MRSTFFPFFSTLCPRLTLASHTARPPHDVSIFTALCPFGGELVFLFVVATGEQDVTTTKRSGQRIFPPPLQSPASTTKRWSCTDSCIHYTSLTASGAAFFFTPGSRVRGTGGSDDTGTSTVGPYIRSVSRTVLFLLEQCFTSTIC